MKMVGFYLHCRAWDSQIFIDQSLRFPFCSLAPNQMSNNWRMHFIQTFFLLCLADGDHFQIKMFEPNGLLAIFSIALSFSEWWKLQTVKFYQIFDNKNVVANYGNIFVLILIFFFCNCSRQLSAVGTTVSLFIEEICRKHKSISFDLKGFYILF